MSNADLTVYPDPFRMQCHTNVLHVTSAGMSLRDKFADDAMNALIKRGIAFIEVAEAAYLIADSMMIQRAK